MVEEKLGVGHGVGVGDGVAVGDGVGVGLADGSGDVLALGDGDGDGAADGDGDADGATLGDALGAVLADGLAEASGDAPPPGSAAMTGTPTDARTTDAMSAADSQHVDRSAPGARRARLAMDMLPSLEVQPRTGDSTCGPRRIGPEYQRLTPGATVASMLRIYLGHGAAG